MPDLTQKLSAFSPHNRDLAGQCTPAELSNRSADG